MPKKLLIISTIISFSFIQSTDVSDQKKKNEAFLDAASANELKKAKELLDAGADINAVSLYGYNALMRFIGALTESDSLAMARLLIDSKINIDHQNNLTGNTALSMASTHNRPLIVKLLLENNANKDLKDYLGKTALDCAIENNNNEIIQLLLPPAPPAPLAPMPQTPAQMPTVKGDSKTAAEQPKE